MLKVKGWKREWQVNSKEQKAGVSTLISNKIAFHTKCVIKDEWCHVMMMKDSTHQEDRVILNLDAPLKSVMFSLPSVSPLEFSPSSAPGFSSCLMQFILHSAASVAFPLLRQILKIKPRFLSIVPLDGAGSSVLYPPLPTPAPSQPLHSIISCSFYTFGCTAAFVQFGLSSSTRLVDLNAPSLEAFSALPLLDGGLSCCGSKKTFSIFHSIISHVVILASLFA